MTVGWEKLKSENMFQIYKLVKKIVLLQFICSKEQTQLFLRFSG
jgi:hypothetical protein